MSVVFDSTVGSLLVLRSSLFAGVPHGLSTRHGGVSPAPYDSLNLGLSTADREENVLENRGRFFASLGFRPDQVVAARLTHGRDVATFHREGDPSRPGGTPVDAARSTPDGASFCADGVVSDVPGLAFFMTFADCVPLLLADTRRGVVGAAHAGWRGTALSIAAEVVGVMRRDFGCDPSDIVTAIGPSIGPCCYDVSDEVPAAFAAGKSDAVLVLEADDRTHLDLWETNRRQLVNAGIVPSNIDSFGLCTGCNTSEFYSHRKERGVTGRHGLCIGLDASR